MTAKVALVTGSGKRRVGWHVADALAERGYALAVHYRTSAAEAEETVAYLKNKGAIPTLTRSLAVELGTRNPKVRVNCILPGPVMLPPDLPEQERLHSMNATLVKREGRPENIAQAVLCLIDNDFVTGACLPVD